VGTFRRDWPHLVWQYGLLFLERDTLQFKRLDGIAERDTLLHVVDLVREPQPFLGLSHALALQYHHALLRPSKLRVDGELVAALFFEKHR
jgi:hypothetical protein